MKDDIICWWSGGIASAVACKLSIDIYGLDRCRFIMIDTSNEDDDTYRFKEDCSKWYGKEIEIITSVGKNKKYSSIKDVWFDNLSLNVAHGAICSSELKKNVRVEFQRKNSYTHQVFGFDDSEPKRARNIKKNYPVARPIFPLLLFMYSKQDCLRIVEDAGIEIPLAYKEGYRNNNCQKTGCVQGGVSYWGKIMREQPEKYAAMAKIEHDITNLKGQPVTILKDQSNKAKVSGVFKVFLLPHPDYPDHKDITHFKERFKNPEPLQECNGFCGIQTSLFNQV